MTDMDPAEKIKELAATLASVTAVLDLEATQTQIAELREQSADPELWSDQDNAQKVTRELAGLESMVNKVDSIEQRLDDLGVLYELAEDEDDPDTVAEADNELEQLRKDIGALEVRTLLNGPYDEREAIVTINSQAGGIDAADWAQMLQRMYLRWAERRGYSTEIYETSYAEEAGIKSTSFAVKAQFAYGTLRGEHGTHRLVRISPFDNQHRRQTSFAGVDVVPMVEKSDHIDIDESDLRVDVYRSSGPGGQGVNTTDSAVRITHIPTGIVVSCQNERSQLQNRATAMSMLQAKLLARKREEEQAEIDEIRGDTVSSWGTQMRNYVLHPYQSVKDVRTGAETGNTAAVLDGEIDEFIDSEIRWMRSQEQVDS
ncbi:MAG TPA: peptide chain release factor 2 [Candidatus Nocardiopsis merdipullorum]|nr:peptide chain release factor 2 [Candidatus Nocardiopsis merdipullorum]